MLSLSRRTLLRAPSGRLPAASTSASGAARTFSATAGRRADMIELEVDGKKVSVERGSSLIQACEIAGSTIPRFCYHDRLKIAGNCRMCLVEVSPGPPKPQASCAMPAMPGQKVKTNSPTVHKAREGVMEFLLANHPLDCPICDQGGQCDLQDQSMRYGSDRARFHEVTGKRATEDKNFGPIVKTVMTRCIHCTRCVRFANEVAGVEDLGTSGRGNDMQIGTYIEKALDSEMSGNVIDLCPVGALTAKPIAFESRQWELKNTESIDVTDAVGSNIVVDSRGVVVMRIQPRVNDWVNEEWINDKTRFAPVDGLRVQRLTTPLVRQGERFVPATWPAALEAIKEGLAKSGAKGDEIQGVAGQLADVESLVALKDLINRLGSENTVSDTVVPGAFASGASADFRASYTYGAGIPSVEEADKVLLVGTNPRHEAAILNTRMRKAYLKSGTDFALIGEDFKSTFQYEKLGGDLAAVKELVAGKGKWGKELKEAKKPLIVIGSAVTEGHMDGAEVVSLLAAYAEANKATFATPEWTGLNFLQRHAGRTGAQDIGFTSSTTTKAAKFIYLLNSDEFDPASIPRDAFVVYQGHHGDVGAQYADVCLPGSAFTEKSTTWVNTEGRVQLSRAAVPPPGAAREDWKIIRALSEVLGATLPYDDTVGIRDRMWDVNPALVKVDSLEVGSDKVAALKAAVAAAKPKIGKATQGLRGAFKKPIENFYLADAISRSSSTMAKCSKAFVEGQGLDVEEPVPQGSYA